MTLLRLGRALALVAVIAAAGAASVFAVSQTYVVGPLGSASVPEWTVWGELFYPAEGTAMTWTVEGSVSGGAYIGVMCDFDFGANDLNPGSINYWFTNAAGAVSHGDTWTATADDELEGCFVGYLRPGGGGDASLTEFEVAYDDGTAPTPTPMPTPTPEPTAGLGCDPYCSVALVQADRDRLDFVGFAVAAVGFVLAMLLGGVLTVTGLRR